jgi:hypothetical protein
MDDPHPLKQLIHVDVRMQSRRVKSESLGLGSLPKRVMIVIDHVHQFCPKRSPGTERLVLHQCKPLSVLLPDFVSELAEFGRKLLVNVLDLRGGEFDQTRFDVVGVCIEQVVVIADQFIDAT